MEVVTQSGLHGAGPVSSARMRQKGKAISLESRFNYESDDKNNPLPMSKARLWVLNQRLRTD